MRRLDVSWLFASALVAAACGVNVNVGEAAPPSGSAGVDDADASTPPTPTPSLPPGPAKPDSKTFAEKAVELGKRWQWLDPLPSGEPMFAVAGTSMSDIYYAGAAGTVVRWNGVGWNVYGTSPDVILDRAWAPAPGHVWVAGLDSQQRGHLYRMHDGVATEDDAFNGFAVHALTGIDESHAWALGAYGMVKEWNGTAWSTIRDLASGTLDTIHAFSTTDVWAAGWWGQIVHYDGKEWTTAKWDGVGENPFDIDYRYEGIWGAAPNDLWAVALRETPVDSDGQRENLPVFSHFDGRRWSVVLRPQHVCGATPAYSYGSWWSTMAYSLRRPFGGVLAGTSGSNIVFANAGTCPWRFDGATWKEEPLDWTWSDFKKEWNAGHLPRRPAVAALADKTILVGDRRFDPSAPVAPREGESRRWPSLRPKAVDRFNLTRDSSGGLWSTPEIGRTIAQWTPRGWLDLQLDDGVLLGWNLLATKARSIVARHSADVWVAGPRPGALASLGHWTGSNWEMIPVPGYMHQGYERSYHPEALTFDDAHVWAIARGGPAESPRLLMKLSSDGPADTRIRATAKIHDSFDYGDELGAGASLLADAKTKGRLLFAFVTGKDWTEQNCVIGSWDGESAVRREVFIPSCDQTRERRIRHMRTQLLRIDDARVALLTPRRVFSWDGTSAEPRIEASAKDGVLTLTTKTSAATLATRATSGEPILQELAHESGSRYWILAGGGLFLWDTATDEIALARHASELSSLVVAPSGEAWSLGSGLLHYAPPSQPLTPPTK